VCLSKTTFCPPGRIFASEDIRLITSIYPKEVNVYPKEIRVIATCLMQMQNYLAFLILKCAVILPAFETGNVLEVAKQDNNVPCINVRFNLPKSVAIY
jgi:hypothetical protein